MSNSSPLHLNVILTRIFSLWIRWSLKKKNRAVGAVTQQTVFKARPAPRGADRGQRGRPLIGCGRVRSVAPPRPPSAKQPVSIHMLISPYKY